jgi:hypothetical protein
LPRITDKVPEEPSIGFINKRVSHVVTSTTF